MADLPISSAASLTHSTIAVGDLFPLVDISAASGSKGSKITLTELAASIFTVGSTVATSIQLSSLGVSTTPALTLTNPTAAAAGAQQMSPAFTLTGQGWKTNATAGSQTVSWRQEVLPVQGAANPSALWRLQGNINGSDVAHPQIQAQTNGPVILTGVAGVAGSLMLRHPDAYMGDAAIFTLDGTGGISFGSVSSSTNSAIGLRVIEYGNSSNFIGLLSIGTRQSIFTSSAVLAISNGTTAQTLQINGTYTDSSNYRRLNIGTTTAGVFSITPQGAGTGASGNVLHLSGLPTSNPGPDILWNNLGVIAVGT